MRSTCRLEFRGLVCDGLELLKHLLSILVAVDSIFSNFRRSFNNISEVYASIVGDKLPNTKNMLKYYLHDLYLDLGQPTRLTSRSIRESFNSILTLFLIRVTIRSILRYSYQGFTASGWQINQDHSFDRGLSCILYQPMLLDLEHSKVTLAEIPYPSFGILQPWSNSTPWEVVQDIFSKYFRQQSLEEKSSNMIQLKTGIMNPSTQIELPGWRSRIATANESPPDDISVVDIKLGNITRLYQYRIDLILNGLNKNLTNAIWLICLRSFPSRLWADLI